MNKVYSTVAWKVVMLGVDRVYVMVAMLVVESDVTKGWPMVNA